MAKNIRRQGLIKLMANIIHGKAKFNKTYHFKEYKIHITRKIPMTINERVKQYYIDNPHKIKERNNQKKDKYNERRKKNLCVKCGRKTEKHLKIGYYAMCKNCRKRHNELQNKKIK